MPQQPKSDPARAARARQVAMHVADVLDGESVQITWPRFLQIQELVAGMLPPAPSPKATQPLTAPGSLAERIAQP